MIKNTWKICASKEHIELYYKIINKARELGYLKGAETPPLYTCKQSTRALGWCSYKIVYGVPYTYSKSITSNGICISEGFLSLEASKATETLVHEIAHFCSAWKYGEDGVHHNARFRSIGNHIGWFFDVEIDTHTTNHEIANSVLKKRVETKTLYKYELYCPVCGKVFNQYKTECNAIKYPSRYYHKNCPKGVYPATKLSSRKIKNK